MEPKKELNGTCKNIAKALIEDAKNKGSKDNLTAVVTDATQHPLQINVILDGHGGQAVAEFVKDKLPNLFKKEFGIDLVLDTDSCSAQDSNTRGYQEDRAVAMYLEKLSKFYTANEIKTKIETINNKVITMIDKKKDEINAGETGSCVSIGVVQFDKNTRKLTAVTGNLGDSSHCLISTHSDPKILTENMHQAKNPTEVNRVKEEGGIIFRGRLGGNLAVTRAYGDLGLVEYGLSQKMDFNIFETDVATDEKIFFIGTCDGVSDEKEEAILHPKSIKNHAKKFLIDQRRSVPPKVEDEEEIDMQASMFFDQDKFKTQEKDTHKNQQNQRRQTFEEEEYKAGEGNMLRAGSEKSNQAEASDSEEEIDMNQSMFIIGNKFHTKKSIAHNLNLFSNLSEEEFNTVLMNVLLEPRDQESNELGGKLLDRNSHGYKKISLNEVEFKSLQEAFAKFQHNAGANSGLKRLASEILKKIEKANPSHQKTTSTYKNPYLESNFNKNNKEDDQSHQSGHRGPHHK